MRVSLPLKLILIILLLGCIFAGTLFYLVRSDSSPAGNQALTWLSESVRSNRSSNTQPSDAARGESAQFEEYTGTTKSPTSQNPSTAEINLLKNRVDTHDSQLSKLQTSVSELFARFSGTGQDTISSSGDPIEISQDGSVAVEVIPHSRYNAYANLAYYNRIDTVVSTSLLTQSYISQHYLSSTTLLTDLANVSEENLSSGKVLKWDGEKWAPSDDNTGSSGPTYTASNGLTLDGNALKIGGTLGENTTINADGKTLTLGSGNFVVGGAVTSSGAGAFGSVTTAGAGSFGSVTTTGTVTATGAGSFSSVTATSFTQNGNVVCDESGNCGIGAGVVGTGTLGFLSRWTGASALGNSIIYDTGTGVGIGTIAPGVYVLNVNGNSNVTGTLDVSGTMTASSFVGNLSGNVAGNLVGDVAGDVTGNASTATALQSARTIALSGGATGTATSFSGTSNITIPITALHADNLDAGTVPAARLSGSYTGITGLGTITTGVWQGTILGAAYGGTGIASYTIGDLVYASGATTLSKLSGVATGNTLLSGGVGAAPAWGKVVLGTHTSGNYVATTTGTSNQVVASASTGAITLSLPQDIHAGATPTFSDLTYTPKTTPATATGKMYFNSGDGKLYLYNGSVWVDLTATGATYAADGNGIELSTNTFSLELDGSTLATSGTGLRLSSAYPGQASITTIGTISTGVWQGSAIGDSYISSALNWSTAYNSRISSFTTTGSSGAATFSSNTLNIPNYTLAGLGGQTQLNGTGFVKASGTTISYDNSTYLTGNQTITLSGDITGSGTTAITTAIGAAKVTNTMLAGSIANAKLTNSSITIGSTSISLGSSSTTLSGLTSLSVGGIITGTGSGLTGLTVSNFTSANISQWTNNSGYITSPNDAVSGSELDGVFSTTGLLTRTGENTYSTITDSSSNWNTAYGNRIATFTTTGSSGAATFSSNTLNIPTYTLAGLGGEPTISAGTTAQYWRGDKSWQTLNSAAVGLGNVTNAAQLVSSTTSTQSGYFENIFLYDDSTPSHYLAITNSANLTALRTLSINVNNADRTVSLSGNLTVSSDATISGTNTGDQTLGGLGGQTQLNGTGFVKASGTTITYDNSTYLTAEVDGSITNEIQTLGTSGNTITLTSGGSVTAPYATSAGTASALAADPTDCTAGSGGFALGINASGTAVCSTNGTGLSLTAGNLSGTIPSAVLGNSTVYIGTTAITLNRTSASQTLSGVSITGNAGTATTLATTRTLWGQNFNGSANVTGNLTSVGNITGSGAVTITAGGSNQNIRLTPSGTGYTLLDGNVGIGTTSPTGKLTLSGGNFIHAASGSLMYQGAVDTLGSARDVFVSGNYAFVADTSAGLQIIDVSESTNPSVIGSVDTSGLANSVFVSGKYAYIADKSAGLQIIDISNPYTPILVGTYNTPGVALDVYVSGRYAYIADESAGLQIIDISNPNTPIPVGNYDTLQASGLYISGKYAYVADSLLGLVIIDISDPENPAFIGTYDTIEDIRDLYVSGRYAYLVGINAITIVLDVSDPANPLQVGSDSVLGSSYGGISVNGNYAYVAAYTQGVFVMDISDRNNPILIGSYDTPDSSWNIRISGTKAYVADGLSGLVILRINGTETPSLSTGALETGSLSITENGLIGNNLNVQNALNVGAGGIFTNGIITAVGSDSNYFAGNVGIGVTAPAYKLELPNVANATGQGRANAWQTYSDARYKDNVTQISDPLNKVLQLQGVNFNWINGGEYSSGFISQEVELIIPELVSTDNLGFKSLDYGRFTPYLVEAFKGMHQLVTSQVSELTTLKSTTTQFEEEVVTTTAITTTELVATEVRHNALAELVRTLSVNVSELMKLEAIMNWKDGVLEVLSELIVNGPSFFRDTTTFEAPIKLSADTSGTLTIPAETLSAKVTFGTPFPEVPTVYINFPGRETLPYTISELTVESFIITFDQGTSEEMLLQWLAVLSTESEKSPQLEVLESAPASDEASLQANLEILNELLAQESTASANISATDSAALSATDSATTSSATPAASLDPVVITPPEEI